MQAYGDSSDHLRGGVVDSLLGDAYLSADLAASRERELARDFILVLEIVVEGPFREIRCLGDFVNRQPLDSFSAMSFSAAPRSALRFRTMRRSDRVALAFMLRPLSTLLNAVVINTQCSHLCY